MSTASLTAKYRPQTFSEVAGQEAIKTILSRAAAQDKVAPAYLFSGTRGVGKTTIARIFAKALNCVNGPAAEPCNECVHCKQITAGIGVDVVEIDAASHGKVDDARRLKEDIGYAPIECRYKVFIIDEAHMLTTQAFNALLKTLEEPPPHATFIMATTETHKFPATIISRCQHYSFKMLSMPELTEHLENILQKENIDYEKGAVSLIAKRGAGSVRDSMSLLGQVLALGNEKLVESDIRSILGLAGKDVFFTLMQAIHDRDLVSVGEVVRQVLDQGLDLGFFIRELGSFWRNLFLIAQSGERALPLLELSSSEAQDFIQWANTFDRSFIHACWQMTVDGQRKVLTSIEPALALELLLLNMANLPDLISMEKCGVMMNRAAANSQSVSRDRFSGNIRNDGVADSRRPYPSSSSSMSGLHNQNSAVQNGTLNSSGLSGTSRESKGAAQSSSTDSSEPSSQEPYTGGDNSEYVNQDTHHFNDDRETGSHIPVQSEESLSKQETDSNISDSIQSTQGVAVKESSIEDNSGNIAADTFSNTAPTAPSVPRSFKGFLDYASENGINGNLAGLRKCDGKFEGNTLSITCSNRFHHGQVTGAENITVINRLAKEYFGSDTIVDFKVRKGAARKSRKDLQNEAESNPDITRIIDMFGASIVSVENRKK